MIIKKPQDTDSLHEILLRQGYAFPCGGKGLCGRCKIVSPSIAPTNLDYRFFSQIDIDKGIRLACDKKLIDDTDMEVLFAKSAPTRKLEYPQIIAIINNSYVELALVDDVLVESRIFLLETRDTSDIRAVIGKNSVEYFEKYGVAKAVVTLVVANHADIQAFANKQLDYSSGNTYNATDFDMPSEEVYITAIPNKWVSSNALLELLPLPNEQLLILEKENLFIYKGNKAVITALIDTGFVDDINEGIYGISAKAFIATIRYFAETVSLSDIKIITDKLDVSALNAMLKKHGITINKIPSRLMESATKLLQNNRYKTQLDKLAKKVTTIDLVAEDLWQDLLSE